MGRPLNKKYFGNRNTGVSSPTDDGLGGEGVASVTLGGTNNSSGFTNGASVTFSAPQEPNGVTATGTLVVTAGQIQSVTITNKGSGYTAAPTITLPSGTQGTLTLTVVMTSTQENAIICYAYIPTANGGSSRVIADIIRQVSTTRYKVRTAQGVGICQLVTDGTSGSGKMDITAYDAAGSNNEYWVTKLTARTVTLVAKGGGIGGSQFTNGKQAKWTFGSAVAPSGDDIGTAKIQNTI